MSIDDLSFSFLGFDGWHQTDLACYVPIGLDGIKKNWQTDNINGPQKIFI
ncbi:hypothetical protein [Paludibacterium yongneupense]|nr:hypothetical protein [Paludibacterium yongneupense]